MLRDPLRIYLAGAIRDGCPDDITWRETVVDRLGNRAILLNPLAGKSYVPDAKRWHLYGRPVDARFVVAQDYWGVDRADLIVFNFLPLAAGYPSIGTLVEFGRASTRSVLRYVIVPSDYAGQKNEIFDRHPFLDELAAARFDTVASCIDFLDDHLDALSGAAPRYRTDLAGGQWSRLPEL